MMKRLSRLAPSLLALALVACTLGDPTPTARLAQPPNAPTAQVAIITPGATQVGVPPATAVPGTLPPGATVTPRPSVGPTMTPAPGMPTSAPGTPTATPNAAIKATKLTADNCCPRPIWLPDSSGVLFYGAPLAGNPQRGTWKVAREGGTPQLYSAAYGAFSSDRSLIATPDGDLARIVRPDGTTVGGIVNGGKRAYLAATNDRVAWMVPAQDVAIVSTSLDPPFQVAIARPDGGGITTLPPVFIGETLQWFPDGRRILVNGRDSRAEHPGLWILDTNTGTATQIFTSPWLENVAISPDGTKIVYTATLQTDKSLDGIWMINVDGSGRQKLPLTGGYRWTPDGRSLLYLPAPTTNRTNDELWRYALADGARTPLIGGEQLSFTVAQDEWEIAPDGTAIAYRSATDGAIWTLRFAR